jgi:hypothetical protein
MLSIPNQLEAAYMGQDVSLECHTEAYPSSLNYWITERGDMIVSGEPFPLFITHEDEPLLPPHARSLAQTSAASYSALSRAMKQFCLCPLLKLPEKTENVHCVFQAPTMCVATFSENKHRF